MKREILFRGKSINTGEWIYGSLSTGNNPEYGLIGWVYPGDLMRSSDVVEMNTVGQKSCFIDMDHKPLYEGDFVLYTDWKDRPQINQIYFHEGYSSGWRIKGGKWSAPLTSGMIYNSKMKIVGNTSDDTLESLTLKYSIGK